MCIARVDIAEMAERVAILRDPMRYKKAKDGTLCTLALPSKYVKATLIFSDTHSPSNGVFPSSQKPKELKSSRELMSLKWWTALTAPAASTSKEGKTRRYILVARIGYDGNFGGARLRRKNRRK